SVIVPQGRTQMNERILISGASIAGLTTAHWLARHGFHPTIVERAPGLRPGGNGVDLRDQAVDIAEHMGIMPQVRAAATDVQGTKSVGAGDRGVARMDVRGASEVEIMRGALVALLPQATGPGVEYIFGASTRRLEQAGDGVRVPFAHADPRRFD